MSSSLAALANASGANAADGPFVSRWRRLSVCLATLASFWLIVLPWLSVRPPMSDRLEWLEDQKIDPSAMYYTELEVLKPVLERLNAGHRLRPTDPDAPR